MHELIDGAELRRRCPGDALARLVIPDAAPVVWDDGAWAGVHPWLPGWEREGISTGPDGDPTGVVAALLERAPSLPALGWVGTERGQTCALPRGWVAENPGEWDLMTTTVAPPSVRAFAFCELDDARDAAEIADFNARHNPASEGDPGSGANHLWLALRDDAGALVAVGAWQPLATGAPYLAGLVVADDRRGQGIGAALLGELTRRALADHDEVCLGVDAANTRAAALYRRLGWTTGRRFTTRTLRRADA